MARNMATAATRYPIPTHILYRGVLRRVYDVIAATHKGHSHRRYVLKYKPHVTPPGIQYCAFGPRGQKHTRAVWVRADHALTVRVKMQHNGKRGRPKIRRIR